MSKPSPEPKQFKGARRYDAEGRRICTGCRVFLDVSAFGRSKAILDGLNILCRPCHAARCERNRQNNPERYRLKATEKARAWRARNTEKVNESSRKQRRKIRAEILAHYGDHCVCCGEREPLFLSLDHINNDGNEERKESKKRKEVGSGIVWYYRLRKNGFPDGLQVLCYNCNMAKGIFGECPHQREVRDGFGDLPALEAEPA